LLIREVASERSEASKEEPMLFDIEIVLRDRETAIAEQLEHDGNDVPAWTELDVHEVLKSMLLAIDRAKNPGSDRRVVALRGFSWIVEPTVGGVVIALEIPTGAAVAGPFDIPQARLDALIANVLAEARPASPVVH
jgi:hypothetical protein